jgi:hypothetical protein
LLERNPISERLSMCETLNPIQFKACSFDVTEEVIVKVYWHGDLIEFGSLEDGRNPKNFHFVAVSTLVASDLDECTLEEMI